MATPILAHRESGINEQRRKKNGKHMYDMTTRRKKAPIKEKHRTEGMGRSQIGDGTEKRPNHGAGLDWNRFSGAKHNSPSPCKIAVMIVTSAV